MAAAKSRELTACLSPRSRAPPRPLCAAQHKAEARLAAFVEKHGAAFAPPRSRGASSAAGGAALRPGAGVDLATLRGSLSASLTVASSSASLSTEPGGQASSR